MKTSSLSLTFDQVILKFYIYNRPLYKVSNIKQRCLKIGVIFIILIWKILAAAAVAQWVRVFASQAEGCVFKSKLQET